MEKQVFGPLSCYVVDHQVTDNQPDLAVILCHGYGAGGDDLVPLADETGRHLSQGLGVRFVFPEAPLKLEEMVGYDARAWWELSLNRLLTAIESGQVDVLREVRPEGLDDSREKLKQSCEAILSAAGLSWNETILGGFSQGAMITTDLALRLDPGPRHLVVMSGTLLNEKEWRELASQRSPLSVLQSHGKLDPVLPFQAAEWLTELFREYEFPLEMLAFMGPHTIHPEMITKVADRLNAMGAA